VGHKTIIVSKKKKGPRQLKNSVGGSSYLTCLHDVINRISYILTYYLAFRAGNDFIDFLFFTTWF